MQPYKHHSNIPGGISRIFKNKFIYSYSFALNPEEYQPSGSYNFGKLNDKASFEFTGTDFTNFTMELFVSRYEYLTITAQSVNVSSVPTQTYVDSSIENTSADTGTSKSKTPAGKTVSKQNKAVATEIKKRYTAEMPHLHVHEHAHIHKKKWTGLQGQFLNEKKKNDLQN
jgi:hypothetical protein